MRPRQHLILIGIAVLLLIAPVTAQFDPVYLQGPLLAANPARHDAIWLYDVGGDSYRELDFGAGWTVVWDFSPDGCHILFTKSDTPDGHARLYRARIDGQDVRELVSYDELPADDWGIWEPDWSPDGERIAFKMVRDDAQPDGTTEREYHIGWVPPEGGTPEFYSVTGREHEPQWSPDGEWLVYMSYSDRAAGVDLLSTAVPTAEPPPDTTPPPPVLVSEADLWVVSADGETKYQLTNFSVGSVRAPRWSPDGDLVGFVYSPGPNNDTFAMIGAADDARPTQLHFNWALILDLTWLPDSTRIIGAARDFREVAENRLWSIPLVGNADETAELYLQNANLTHADYPRFSADGGWLATRTAYDLALVNLSDGGTRLLNPAMLGNTPPVWSPSGFDGEAACLTPGG